MQAIPFFGQLAYFIAAVVGAYTFVTNDFSFEKAVLLTAPEAKRSAHFSVKLTELEQHYLEQLQNWIDTDGNPQSVQERVVKPCSKLAIISAPKELAASFLRREKMNEYDFRVNFCLKATVHQKFPQPEFENVELIKKTCTQSVRFFSIVCEKYHL